MTALQVPAWLTSLGPGPPGDSRPGLGRQPRGQQGRPHRRRPGPAFSSGQPSPALPGPGPLLWPEAPWAAGGWALPGVKSLLWKDPPRGVSCFSPGGSGSTGALRQGRVTASDIRSPLRQLPVPRGRQVQTEVAVKGNPCPMDKEAEGTGKSLPRPRGPRSLPGGRCGRK